MPPIQLSRRERDSLQKILQYPRPIGEIPRDHEEKLVNYGLARKRVLLLYITPVGHIELLRQGFRGLRLLPLPQLRLALAAPLPRRLLTSQIQDSA